jgi:hypothetical protein
MFEAPDTTIAGLTITVIVSDAVALTESVATTVTVKVPATVLFATLITPAEEIEIPLGAEGALNVIEPVPPVVVKVSDTFAIPKVVVTDGRLVKEITGFT